MNALDELEALGDSMESLDSCGSADDTNSEPVVNYKTKSSSGTSKPKTQALLVDNDSDDCSDEVVSSCSFGSTGDLTEVSSSPIPPWIEIGIPVIVLSTKGDQPEKGYIRFVGQTRFADGNWIGVQLDSPQGKNNGTVQDVTYFSCKPKHGVFVRHDRLLQDKKRAAKSFPNPEVNSQQKSSDAAKTPPTNSSTPSYLKPTQSSRSKKSK